MKPIECTKCGQPINQQVAEQWWDEKGYGYSTKQCRCPNCERINIIKYIGDYHFDTNRDLRFYIYTQTNIKH